MTTNFHKNEVPEAATKEEVFEPIVFGRNKRYTLQRDGEEGRGSTGNKGSFATLEEAETFQEVLKDTYPDREYKIVLV